MDRNSDRRLITRLQAGDETAVHELAEQYGPRIFQLALRQMKNREDAEEVAQDVLLKVQRKIGAFRGDSALSSWIYRITFNTSMSRLRGNRAARTAEQERDRLRAAQLANIDGERVKQPSDWSRMPDEELLRSQLRRAVARAISELPEIYRAPVVLRDIQGLTTEEASSRLKLKDQTLKSRLHRGRLMLRDRLRPFTTGLTLHRQPAEHSYRAAA
jgi:RNA polymerase sigma-70 factor (ECF subfamily)